MLNRDKEFVAKMTFMNDPLFKEAVKKKEFCQEFLRILYGDPKLIVLESNPEWSVTNPFNKEVKLDARCITGDGKYVDIEVQNANNDDIQKRARYNGSILTVNVTNKGDKYKDVPNVCVIFITKFDPFKKNLTIYHVERIIKETGEVIDNGLEEIYINTKVNDGSKVAELMRIFSTPYEYNDTLLPEISKVKRYLKEDPKGVSKMCELTKEIWTEGREEGREEGEKRGKVVSIRSLMDSVGWTAEKAMDALKINPSEREFYLLELEKEK